MNKKMLFSVLLLSGTLALSSCSLFKDDDIMEPNIYHPQYDEEEEIPAGATIAGEVIGKTMEDDPNVVVYKNIGYGTYDAKKDEYFIFNSYKEGESNFNGYHVNHDEDYPKATSVRNNYDLYIPKNLPRDQKHTVILFIHGGAWVSGFKTDVNAYIHEFAKRGYITATIKYTLLKRTMDDDTLSIFRNLDEIDACIKSIKTVLSEITFDTSKTELVLGGASSGAHLAMLYAYSRGKNSALSIKFLVDAVGPVDIKPDAWKEFINPTDSVLDAGIDKTALETQIEANNTRSLQIMGEGGKRWTDYQTFRIANGMCGLPYTLEEVKAASDESEEYIVHPENAAYQNMISANGGEDLLSVTYWINKADESSKFPIICAYAGKDSIVGINQYATLQTALEAKGITSYTASSGENYIYFRYSTHELVINEGEPHYQDYVDRYNELINAVDIWCQA